MDVTKAELRRDMRARLATLLPQRTEKSRAIVAALEKHPALAGSRLIALFSPMDSEPDVEGLWTGTTHRFCYPRITEGRMEFVEVRRHADLTPSSWHAQIRELAHLDARVVSPAEINVMLAPGLAFTAQGQRLGRGGGYYDRYLETLGASTLKIGVCFAVQIVKALPIEPHDQLMNAVLTEDGFLLPVK